MLEKIGRYLNLKKFPHLWCPGCGNGIVLGAFARALYELGYDQDKIVVASGIGCSSRTVAYLNLDTLHTTHGRALAYATGVKLARPDLRVFAIMGDGDSLAIGGNHFIHAARRNIGITAIIINNYIYGMTGGQYSPLTPRGKGATTAPYGMFERSFDIPTMARAAGATYVARATVYHATLLKKLIEAASEHQGFSVVEAVSICPVSYGRRNKLGDAPQMLNWLKENSLRQEQAANLKPEAVQGKLIIGELYRGEAPEYTAAYDQVIASAQGL